LILERDKRVVFSLGVLQENAVLKPPPREVGGGLEGGSLRSLLNDRKIWARENELGIGAEYLGQTQHTPEQKPNIWVKLSILRSKYSGLERLSACAPCDFECDAWVDAECDGAFLEEVDIGIGFEDPSIEVDVESECEFDVTGHSEGQGIFGAKVVD
jgi:hypothetical protein